MKRTPFAFTNKHNLRVKGVIFESPEGKVSKVGVLYLPGIVLGMTAVHRLGVDVSCQFQSLGYPVLLFAPSRVGESEGELFSGTGEEFGNFIKKGGFVDDTLEAIGEFCRQRKLESVILVGHCGGALTALYAAQRDRRVKKIILISPPLTGELPEARAMTRGQSKELLALYRRKLFSWEAWKRLFTGKSDYGQISRSIQRKVRDVRLSKEAVNENINQRLIDGLEKTARTIGIQIIYGDRDPGIEEFINYQDTFQQWKIRCRVLPDTSHGFVTEDSMQLLMEELSASS